MNDPYRILGVARDATDDDIKRAFRRMALRYHPDRNPDDPEAERVFKQVTQAYELLSDPMRRMQFDRFGRVFTDRAGPGFSSDPADLRELFDHLITEAFGSNPFKRDRKRRGEDLRYTVSLSLEEVASGTERELEYDRQVACETCDGRGSVHRAGRTLCPDCGGSGESRKRSLLRGAGRCRTCGGEGYVQSAPCDDCRGEGCVARSSRVRVKVPAGVEVGQRLKVKGMGNVGRRGGERGDLFVIVDVTPHPYFQRDRADVFCRLPVRFDQLALGAEVPVPTLDGQAVIRIPAGTQPQQVLTLRGHGLPRPRGRGRGDHRVRLVLEVPEQLDDRSRAALTDAAFAMDAGVTALRRQILDLLDEMG